MKDIERKQDEGKNKMLVGELASSSVYDEVFLNTTAGYCIFDENRKLQAFSYNFQSLYNLTYTDTPIGMAYEEYMRIFFENSSVQNMGPTKTVEEFLEFSLKLLELPHAKHLHHLHDGRWMQIEMNKTSTGHWLFLARDVSEVQESKFALQESNARYRSFARLAMDWFWELDENLICTYHSGHQLSPTGIDHAELVGKSRVEILRLTVIPTEALDQHINDLNNHVPSNVVLNWRTNDHQSRHINIIAHPVFNKQGKFTGFLGCGREVTKEINVQSQLNHLAEHDDMTGLINRRAFESILTQLLEKIKVKEFTATLVFMDLDRFKLVNDGGGHEAGDQLLINIAETFCEKLDGQSVIARLGGDEFGIILKTDVNSTMQAINEIIAHISSTPFEWKQRKYTIGASAGLVSIDHHYNDISELMSHADTACYMAKDAGRNQAQLYMYDEYFQDPVSLELKQVNLLQSAMDNDGLLLYLQPIKALQASSSHRHFEVLLRLNDNGVVKSAGEFIPVAEKYDLMQHLDKWVMREALAALKVMRADDLDVSLSINLSGNTLGNKGSVDVFSDLIQNSGVDPMRIVFEVTETVAIKNMAIAKEFIESIKAIGCKFSLDDFGSGLSSFGYLKELSVDYLKIDGSFVKNMSSDLTCKAIVSAFNQLSHELGMKTVAEFVEDEQTEILLRELGIDFAQGYWIGEPRDAQVWVDFVLENSSASKKAS